MNIQILHLLEGARQATGLTVIIDVFRAFTAEAYMIRNHAEKIIPVADVQAAFDYKAQHPDAVLCGERAGIMIEGFDYGNSPSQLEQADLTGKTVVHTTSAGTQGIANAIHADQIIAGSLVCARAIAEYIKFVNPETVSLVCMGLHAERPTEEDTLCAEYIKALVEEKPFPDLALRIQQLKLTDGAKFFDPAQQAVFPEQDFHLCVQPDIFPFVLQLKHDPSGGPDYMERVEFADIPVHPGDMMSQFSKKDALRFSPEVKTHLVYERHTPAEGNFDCALVLGGPEEFMESRAKAAADLFHAGRVPYLMVSGGVCRESGFGYLSEAQILAQYLKSFGVPNDRILLEEEATTTVTNMKCCRPLLQQHFPGKALKLVIVTSNFHIFRSVMLAQRFLSEHTIAGVGAVYPQDNAVEYANHPTLSQWVTGECMCLAQHVACGTVPDFPVI